MVRYLLEVDSLATDEGGVEVTDKSHVLALHLWLALIHYHCCQDEVRLLLSSAFLLNLVLGYQLYSKYSGVFSPMETFVWYGHNVGKKIDEIIVFGSCWKNNQCPVFCFLLKTKMNKYALNQ